MATKKHKKKRIRPVIEEVVSKSAKAHPHIEEPIATEPQNDSSETAIIDDNPINDDMSEKKSSFHLGFFLITFLVAIFVFVVSGAVYVYFSGLEQLDDPKESQTPNPTPAYSQKPEATPVASESAKPSASPSSSPLSVSSLKVNILNGSGKIGEAGKAKTLVEKKGFKVASVGNANTFNFTDTIIQAKASVPEASIKLMQEAISASYIVKVGDKLDSKNTYDIIITVGTKQP